MMSEREDVMMDEENMDADERRIRAAMPRFSAARRAQVAVVTIAMGCALGMATPALASTAPTAVPVEQQEAAPTSSEEPAGSAAGQPEQPEQQELAATHSDQPALAAGGSSIAPQTRAPRLADRITFNWAVEDFTVPYGVDIPAWLNAHDGIFRDGRMLPITTKQVAQEYFYGFGPFVYASTVPVYPNGASLSTVLAWAEHEEDAVVLPELDGYNGIDGVANMQAVDEPSDLPLAPESVVEGISVADASGAAHAVETTGSWLGGDLTVWLGADDGDVLSAAGTTGAGSLALSDTYDLRLDGSFLSPAAGQSLAGVETGSYYVKIAQDIKVDGWYTPLYAGQILRLEVRRDADAPVIGASEVLDAAGSSVDATAQWIAGGVLTMGADGITLRVAVSDPAVTEGSASSGVSAKGIELSLAREGGEAISLAPASYADGVATFTLDVDVVGTGSFDLSASCLTVQDAAGNDASLMLGDASFFSQNGIETLRLVDASMQGPQASVAVQGDGNDAADGSGRLVSNAEQVSASVTFEDPFYGELSVDPAWAAAEPATVTVDGQRTVLDPAAFTSADGARSYELAGISAEGSHTIDFSYRGLSAIHAGLGLFEADAHASVLIDRTAPSVVSAELEGGLDQDMVAAMPDGDRVLVSEGTELALALDDPQREGVDEVSGVASASVAVPVYESMDDEDPELRVFEMDETGVVTIPLAEDGRYDLDEAELTAYDAAGNKLETTVGAVLEGAWDEGSSIDGVLVTSRWGMQADLSVTPPAGEDPNGSFYPGASQVTLTVRDRWFRIHANTAAFRRAIEARVAMAGFEQVLSTGSWTEAFESAGADVWTLDIPFDRNEEGCLPDGTYSVSFGFFGVEDELSFGVDSTAPVLTGAELEGADAENVAHMDDGYRVLASTGSTLRVRVQDLLPRDEGMPQVQGDEEGTSGIDRDEISVQVTRSTDVTGEHKEPAEVSGLAVDSSGWAEIELSREGVYQLEDISFHLIDTCGNERDISLAAYIATLPAEEQASWNFDAILVDSRETAPSVSLSLEDGENTPASNDPYYHRGEVYATAVIDDPWFAVYQALLGDTELTSGTVRLAGAEDAVDMGAGLRASDFERQVEEDGAVRWAATFALPRAELDPALPAEGDYRIELAYGGIAGIFGADAERSRQEFGVDYTAPALGSLVLSDTKTYPVDADEKPWGWLFAEEELITLDVEDNLSGIDDERTRFEYAGSTPAQSAFEGDEDGLSGSVVATYGEDGARLYFEGTSIVATDRAGNTASTGDFSSYADSNIPKGATGLAIDTEAPEVTLSFDNTDVRNGRYYNAARTGTVTVSDASFDLMRQFDPELEVGAVERDGRGSEALTAEDFERVVLDDERVVYRASVVFEDDADWVLSAQLSDPLSHASERVQEAFTIDTQAPALMVEYDNDSVANGMYYKAPRTARITVRDRNFDPALGVVSAQNLSGGAAPGATGFAEVERRSEWRASASFGGEQHYRLQVTASDLAGNVAEPYDSGEFVIDMTAPQVQIAGVAGGHAYSGAVAPSVSFSDTNLDTAGSMATLEGARSGFAYTPDLEETSTETDKTTSFGSLPYEVAYDDVYTVSGDAIDLAGNTAQVSMRFSVNRFGSTYYFAPGSENVPGAYLREAQDVRVVEVNVSGIDTAQTRVELAHDDRAESLAAGEDYELRANADAAGWSATTYTLPAELFDENGFYRVTLTSTDVAGNLSQNTMPGKNADRTASFPIEFAVDGDVPTAALIGIEPRETYLDPEKTVLVDAGDNLALLQARVYVDGHEVAAWDASTFGAGALPELELEADGRPHTYVLEVRDRAGNVANARYENVLVTGDWVTYVLNTPELLMASIGGAVVLASAVAAVAYLAHRRYQSSRAKRDPFGHGEGQG